MDDYALNSQLQLPDTIADFGSLLRDLRQNHGYTIQALSKMIGIHHHKIATIERGESDLPTEGELRVWLTKLGCGRNVTKIILMSRQYRVKHSITLHTKETANPDLLRLLAVYRDRQLTDYDRAMLQLIGRSK